MYRSIFRQLKGFQHTFQNPSTFQKQSKITTTIIHHIHTSTSTDLQQISIIPLTKEFLQQSSDVTSESFTQREEPVRGHLTYNQFKFFADFYLNEAIKENKSLIAIDESKIDEFTQQPKVASVICASDLLTDSAKDEKFLQFIKTKSANSSNMINEDDSDYNIKDTKFHYAIFDSEIVTKKEDKDDKISGSGDDDVSVKLGPGLLNYDLYNQILECSKDLKINFINDMKKNDYYKLGMIWRIWLGSTDKDYLHHELITELILKNTELALKNNYKFIIGESTGKWSQKAFEKCGYKVYNQMDYNTWEYPKNSTKYPLEQWAQTDGFDKFTLMIQQL